MFSSVARTVAGGAVRWLEMALDGYKDNRTCTRLSKPVGGVCRVVSVFGCLVCVCVCVRVSVSVCLNVSLCTRIFDQR
jgi:hypothetical protein